MSKRLQSHINKLELPESKKAKLDDTKMSDIEVIANYIMLEIFKNIPERFKNRIFTDKVFYSYAQNYTGGVKNELAIGDISFAYLTPHNFKLAGGRITSLQPNIFEVVAEHAIMIIKLSRAAFINNRYYYR
jgi:hypothetical protein